MSGSWNGRMLGNPQHSDHDDQSRSAVERFEADLTNLLRQVPSAPLVALNRVREVLPDLDLGYHKLLHKWLKIPYAVALEAQKSPALIAAVHAMMPKRVKRYDPKDILRHTLQIAGNAFDIRTTPYSLACVRERALRPFFEQGVDPRDLPRVIEEAGGIGILDDNQREQAKAPGSREPGGMDTGAPREIGYGPDENPARDTAPKARPGGSEERATKPAAEELEDEIETDLSGRDGSEERQARRTPKGEGRRSFNRRTDLAVTLTEDDLHRVLSQPPGTRVTIDLVVGEPSGAWKTSLAERVEIKRQKAPPSTDDLPDRRHPARLH
ncbi:hypothetical protein [uncultured Enterovirga sp.]|uniref:hypothetical protein n=1 Tax=uncultured Enterovirga sp. TaxID=2026352 RepID=UPI0035CBFAD7